MRHCRHICRFTAPVLAIFALGCSDEVGAPPVEVATALATPQTSLPPLVEPDGILPAYQSEQEQRAAKTDSIDVRAGYREIYGVTAPPAGQLRAIAEFEPVDGVLLAWSGDLSPFFADLVVSVGDAASVYIITPDLEYTDALRDYLFNERVDIRGLKFFEYGHEAFWARDYGPWTVETADGSPAFIDVGYYPNRRRDDAIPTLLGRHFSVPTYRPDFEAEGGNFMTNGEGLCAVTNWMLQQNGLTGSGAALEDSLARYMGCRQTVVLERLEGEGTGHIDMFAKFTAPGVVLVGDYDSRVEPVNAAILDRNAARLAALVRPGGERMQVIRMPMPQADHPVYRSFTNSLLVNGVAIVPSYDTDRGLEQQVLEIYRRALPAGYEVAFVDSSEVITYGGAVHCVTMGFQTGRVRGGGGVEPEPAPEPAPESEPEPTHDADGWTVRPNAPILDRQVTESRITVPSGSGRVQRVSVTVEISHSYVGDLVIELGHGGATTLLYRGSGAGQDLRETFTTTAFAGADADGVWTLMVGDNANQDEGVLRSWTLRIDPAVEDGPGVTPAPAGSHSSSPGAAIPDNGSVQDTIEVDSTARLGQVTVSVDIRHTYVGDLTVTLSHGGQQVTLHRNSGGSQDDLSHAWTVANFEGLAAGGAWTLEVSDTAADDIGELRSWALEL